MIAPPGTQLPEIGTRAQPLDLVAADLAEKVAIAPREWLERWLNDSSAWKKFRRSRRSKNGDARIDQTLPAALPLLEKAVVIE